MKRLKRGRFYFVGFCDKGLKMTASGDSMASTGRFCMYMIIVIYNDSGYNETGQLKRSLNKYI